jgi:hypothetical protein
MKLTVGAVSFPFPRGTFNRDRPFPESLQWVSVFFRLEEGTLPQGTRDRLASAESPAAAAMCRPACEDLEGGSARSYAALGALPGNCDDHDRAASGPIHRQRSIDTRPAVQIRRLG